MPARRILDQAAGGRGDVVHKGVACLQGRRAECEVLLVGVDADGVAVELAAVNRVVGSVYELETEDRYGRCGGRRGDGVRAGHSLDSGCSGLLYNKGSRACYG